MRVDSVIAKTKIEPRPYQRRIVTKVYDMFHGQHVGADGQTEINARAVMIESPTGSGKTVMGLLGCKVMQESTKDLHVGWVAMRRNLLGQAAAENTNKQINVENIHFVSMFDKYPAALVKAKAEGKPILLVVDECQHDAASSMSHLHNLLKPDHILGMTATPFRTDRMKLCFDKVIKDAGIHRLIQDGYLSRYDHYSIQDWNPATVAERYCADVERWGKSIFYFKNLSECFALQSLLAARGVSADVVTGESDWETQLDRFRDGEISCLINCMKLTEGFDEPSLKTAWVRDSGKGCTMQMGGRVFRKFESLPKKQIVQSKQTRWPFIRTAMPEMQFVWQNGEWASLQVNPKINQINENARLAIATTIVEIPQFVLSRQQKKRTLARNDFTGVSF